MKPLTGKELATVRGDDGFVDVHRAVGVEAFFVHRLRAVEADALELFEI